jgi:hypothetical protein
MVRLHEQSSLFVSMTRTIPPVPPESSQADQALHPAAILRREVRTVKQNINSDRAREARKARSLLLCSMGCVPTGSGIAKKSVRSLLSKQASLSGKFPDTELDNVQ